MPAPRSAKPVESCHLIPDVLPSLLRRRWKLVHVLQEQSDRPDLLVGQGPLPRRHARPANAMPYFPIGEAFGIVLYAIGRKLRRSWVESFRHRRGGRVTIRGTVAERAVPPIQVNAGDQIVVRQRDGIGTFRRIAAESRIK